MKKQGKILLADNDDEFRRLWKDRLEREGHRVLATNDARKVVDMLSDNDFDLLIIEELMPSMSGDKFMGEIKKRGVDAPVVFVTSQGDVEAYMDLMNMGAFEYINKPIEEDKVMTVVKKAMESRT